MNEKYEASLSKDVGRKISEPCFRELSFAPHFSTVSIAFDTARHSGSHSTLDVVSSQQAVLADFSPSEAIWKRRVAEDAETNRLQTPSFLCDLCASVF
jgi:hypothetical protein